MFETISNSLNNAVRTILGKAKISEDNINEAIKEIKTALLEADVNHEVAEKFINNVKSEAIGIKVVPGVDPGQQFVKIVFDQLTQLLGSKNTGINWSTSKKPTVVMLCGLQGAGKTTTAAKLALKWLNEGKKPLLVAADVQRPAAIEQLRILAKQINVPIFAKDNSTPVTICQQALSTAELQSNDLIIIDTAGRLHVDNILMSELAEIEKITTPNDILFVCDAMIGQSAVDTANEFKKRLNLTGAVMTKMDSDARGGAALSLKESTGVAIKFITTGEKLESIDEFYPDRMASRILGMGDVISLVEKAQAVIDEKEAEEIQKKLNANSLNLEDFLNQLGQIKKMGALKDLLGFIPGLGSQLKGINIDETQFKRLECIIQSMTLEERRQPEVINAKRKERIAKGSGTSIKAVNDLLTQFQNMKKITGRMGRLGMFNSDSKALENLSPDALPGLAAGRSLFGSKKKGTKAQQKKKKDKKKKRRR